MRTGAGGALDRVIDSFTAGLQHLKGKKGAQFIHGWSVALHRLNLSADTSLTTHKDLCIHQPLLYSCRYFTGRLIITTGASFL